jgi:acetyl-CoA carboxylase carboxyl transferase subunit alpha
MPDDSTTQRIAELESEIAGLPPDSVEARAHLVELRSELGSLRGEPFENPAWLRVKLARHVKRPHSLDYIHRLAPDFSEIHGDRCFGDDAAIVAGLDTCRAGR